MPDRRQAERRDDSRRPLLFAGLGLVGFAGLQLLQPKPTPAPTPTTTCPAGYHLAGGVCVQDPAPPPPVLDTRPTVTAIDGLLVRAGPSTGYRVVGSLSYGTHVTIACQTMGGMVVRSAVWDRLSGPIAGYVSDWYVSTPNVGRFSPGYAVCSGSPPPGPVPPTPTPTPTPTGKAPITRWQDLRAGMVVSTRCAIGAGDYLIEPAGIGLDLLPYGYEPAHRRKRWIVNWQSYVQLMGSGDRRPVYVVTAACLNSVAPGPDLQWALQRAGPPAWGGGAPRVRPWITPAGWCS